MPLLWCSLFVYVLGLGHYAFEHTHALGTLWAELVAAGTETSQLWAVLTGDRHGLTPATTFALGFDVPPALGTVAALEWYVLVGGLLGGAIALVGLGRLAWQETVRGPITMGETVVLAIALALAAGLTGGPLLAGTVLLPFCFGVVVHHTRRLPGWTPSYLYVLPVFGPAAGIALGVAGSATLPLEIVAFGLLPIVGGLWLPLRATIRKRFGR
ncbi:molecular chaperone DnaJ [Natrarchaeobaculum aegyptiacum]|nr:molecular chaperone DnaJ [Natrarchaeobaculum aegyptiacum]